MILIHYLYTFIKLKNSWNESSSLFMSKRYFPWEKFICLEWTLFFICRSNDSKISIPIIKRYEELIKILIWCEMNTSGFDIFHIESWYQNMIMRIVILETSLYNKWKSQVYSFHEFSNFGEYIFCNGRILIYPIHHYYILMIIILNIVEGWIFSILLKFVTYKN